MQTRKGFRLHYFWLYFVYQNFQNGYFQISLFSILLGYLWEMDACSLLAKQTLSDLVGKGANSLIINFKQVLFS